MTKETKPKMGAELFRFFFGGGSCCFFCLWVVLWLWVAPGLGKPALKFTFVRVGHRNCCKWQVFTLISVFSVSVCVFAPVCVFSVVLCCVALRCVVLRCLNYYAIAASRKTVCDMDAATRLTPTKETQKLTRDPK